MGVKSEARDAAPTDEPAAAPSVLIHGGRVLPAVTVDTCATRKASSAIAPAAAPSAPSWPTGATG